MTETYEVVPFAGDLLVNRIPEDIPELKLGYKMALGKVMKSGIPSVAEGALVIFALDDAKEFTFPTGVKFDAEPSQLGMFLLKGGIGVVIAKKV
jgi:hypothetical protein